MENLAGKIKAKKAEVKEAKVFISCFLKFKILEYCSEILKEQLILITYNLHNLCILILCMSYISTYILFQASLQEAKGETAINRAKKRLERVKEQLKRLKIQRTDKVSFNAHFFKFYANENNIRKFNSYRMKISRLLWEHLN